jgi:hypothetical protein
VTPSAQPLPPALARLASALELSSGFLLYFLTGPRDHADSVYLRLRALDPDVELVRHRIRSATDLELADLLSNSADERPRVVFLSGLETLDTATRRELSERLNLLRDSWAPHPARIVFWLPSWGLAEFRRIAPDLFDWRSGLITLNDADLPIRSELEYLVWACERNGGPRRWLAGLDQWSALEQRIRVLPRRVALLGLNPAERYFVLRDFALGFARDALDMADPELTEDLDNLSGHYTMRPQPLVPVLVRSQDAAGKLEDAATPWHALALAAGIPGPVSASAVLAELAATSRLLVLLDAFDGLNLAEGEAPRRWLTQMASSSPPIKMLATCTGPASGYFATWPPASLESLAAMVADDDVPPEQLDRYLELIHLVQELFPSSEDLTLLASYFLGAEADELHFYGARELVATRLIIACARRGLLDPLFFAELTRMRPAHTAEIEAIARSLTSP